MYPIQKLISEEFKNTKLKRLDFIKKLGYANTNKGLRQLDSWLQKGEGSSHFINSLIQALNLSPELIQQTITQTRKIRQEKEHAEDRILFKPYIYTETELKIPTQICISILAGFPQKITPFPPKHQQDSLSDQIHTATNLIAEHYKRNKGYCPFFGSITGYRFVYAFEESIRISSDLKIIEKCTGYFDPGLNGRLRLR